MIVNGTASVPGDKSISHRALMLAAVASGESRIRGLLTGADCRSTAKNLRALGCPVPDITSPGEIRVPSAGVDSWRSPGSPLDCGNSGTTVRLMMGLLASRLFCVTLTGDESLRSRPMRRITDPLERMGATIHELESSDRLPIEICGGYLTGINYSSPKSSAQIKSAVLLAGLAGRVPVTLREPVLSRDHTERMLAGMGVRVRAGHAEGGGWEIEMTPPNRNLDPLDLTIPGDPSSAAFLIALALLAEDGELTIEGVGINPTRTGFFSAIGHMGAHVEIANRRSEGGELVGDIIVRPATLSGIEVAAHQIPSMIDEIPILTVLAARAEGVTSIHGAGELRAKETDRIAALALNLRALGVQLEERPDGLSVEGTDRPLAGQVKTFGDHRIAMAFGVLAQQPGNQIEIDDPGCADVSYPGFFDQLRTLVK